MNLKTLSILNAAGLVVVITVNALANILPINGMTTGQVSDIYANLFVPAGFTFSIWGIIYALLVIFVIYQLVLAFRKSDAEQVTITQTGPLLFVNFMANASWIFAWHYEMMLLTIFLMLVILITLIVLYNRLNIGNSGRPAQTQVLVHLPISVYLGWICVATIANFAAFFTSIEWNGFGIPPEIWAVIVITIGLLIGAYFNLKRSDPYFPLVVIWAYFGIYSRQTALTEGDQTVIIACLTGMAVLFLVLAIQIIRQNFYPVNVLKSNAK